MEGAMADLNELSAQEIGRRLRIARENAGIRQDEAAEVIGMSRPTLVSIEKGTRRVRIQELQLLARHYGVSVNGLLRREAVHTDLVPRFRKMRETEEDHNPVISSGGGDGNATTKQVAQRGCTFYGSRLRSKNQRAEALLHNAPRLRTLCETVLGTC